MNIFLRLQSIPDGPDISMDFMQSSRTALPPSLEQQEPSLDANSATNAQLSRELHETEEETEQSGQLENELVIFTSYLLKYKIDGNIL